MTRETEKKLPVTAGDGMIPKGLKTR